MKRNIVVAIAVIAAAALVAGCGGAQGGQSAASAGGKGPIIDKILFEARTQEDIAIKDVATGRSDIFNYTVSGNVYKGLEDDVRAKLDPYAVTGSSYLSLALNPYPNAAPYTGTFEGKKVFNPFAMQEIRFALNNLMNRKQVIDEILSGAGVAMFTPVTPGQPNSSRFGLVASKLGMTASGNEAEAVKAITAAMEKAAALPENKGKLVKADKFWKFDGKEVTVRMLIRVDDPNVRLPLGRYVADQIEKAGIKVERLEWDRTKCFSLYLSDDPKNLSWNMYTEGWGGGQTYAFWDTNISQMYAPWYANMPGQNQADWWSYKNGDLDKLTSDCVNGRVKDTDEYYTKLLKATDIGLKEAVRLFVASQTIYTPAAKDRFLARMVWGLGDGINKFSWYTADVKPEADGSKVLRQLAFSSRGALFMQAWDPIGTDGCGDTYSQAVVQALGDPEWIASPITGIPIPMTASWDKPKTEIEFQGDKILGKIPVPAKAVIYNALTEKWDTNAVWIDKKGDASEYGYAERSSKPEYAKAWSVVNYTLKGNVWHHGRSVDINDYRYGYARPFELCVQRSKDDKIYEESYAGSMSPNQGRVKGVVFNKDGTITVYGDANYPMDEASLAQLLIPTLMVQGSQYSTYIPWEIHEAIKALVAEGSASKTVYVFNGNGDFTEIDLISQQCVADIKAKLEELKAKKHVPAPLAGFVTPETAEKNYGLALAFIEKHGHAWMSNGGFILDKYDPTNNTAIMVANRDPGYTFDKGYFTKLLASQFAKIDAIKVPAYKKGTDLAVGVTVSEIAFPANVSKAAPKANVKVTLIADKETTFEAKMNKAGDFTATVPASVLDALKPGSYTLVVEAALGTEAGAVETSNVIVN